jgi:dTDP-4-dehydrorhamnose reductase
MKRFLITGGQGMLGGDLALVANTVPQAEVWAPGRDELDVRDSAAMLAAADRVRGGWIVHCAARVDVEGCARDPEAARETIVDGTRNAIAMARASGARLFYPQSFLVYAGAPDVIAEDAEPRPLSLYGNLKFEAEQLIRSELPDALVVRMAGFFGGYQADKNFVGRIIPAMFTAMQRGDTTFSIGDRVWQPTWTRDLAENSLELMFAGKAGTYQMACHGYATFAELAAEIVLALGWSDRFAIEVVDATTVSQSELGKRPDRAVLACSRLRDERLDLQRDWRATLHAYLRNPFFDQFRLKGN